MARKRHTAEEIVAKLRQVDVLMARGRQIIEGSRTDYNTNRPHTSLNGLTPTEFANRSNRDENQNRVY